MANPTLDDEATRLKKEKIRAQKARWLKANPEKNRANAARHYAANSDKVKARVARLYAANPEKAKAKAALWRAAHPDKVKVNAALYRADNPDKVKAIQKESNRKRRSTPEGKLNNALSKHMRRCLSKTTETASQLKHSLPYSIRELRVHIERQFTKGMTWDNRNEWHIDHIIPLSSFKFTSSKDPEFQSAWALSNLRPMWAEENQKKWKHRLTLL